MISDGECPDPGHFIAGVFFILHCVAFTVFRSLMILFFTVVTLCFLTLLCHSVFSLCCATVFFTVVPLCFSQCAFYIKARMNPLYAPGKIRKEIPARIGPADIRDGPGAGSDPGQKKEKESFRKRLSAVQRFDAQF
ncbi:MAG: hypothetical protein II940_02050 [Methanosarcinaceae archaeon]|nr:hypothetical protein [Methanosarcinaceae archaeon]